MYYLLLLLLFLAPQIAEAQGAEKSKTKSALELTMEAKGMIDVSAMDTTFIIDLKYATKDNFTKNILYDSLTIPYLHPLAAEKLIKAHTILKKINPNYRLLIFDCARPLSVQKKMYDVVKHTPYSAYVANPSRTGLHNYGMAVDLSICDQNGKELDMGTPFDFFGSAAGINKEEELIQRGILSRKQVDNRKLLRKVMQEAGFQTIRGEWWHFNAVSLAVAKTKFEVL